MIDEKMLILRNLLENEFKYYLENNNIFIAVYNFKEFNNIIKALSYFNLGSTLNSYCYPKSTHDIWENIKDCVNGNYNKVLLINIDLKNITYSSGNCIYIIGTMRINENIFKSIKSVNYNETIKILIDIRKKIRMNRS